VVLGRALLSLPSVLPQHCWRLGPQLPVPHLPPKPMWLLVPPFATFALIGPSSLGPAVVVCVPSKRHGGSKERLGDGGERERQGSGRWSAAAAAAMPHCWPSCCCRPELHPELPLARHPLGASAPTLALRRAGKRRHVVAQQRGKTVRKSCGE